MTPITHMVVYHNGRRVTVPLPVSLRTAAPLPSPSASPVSKPCACGGHRGA